MPGGDLASLIQHDKPGAHNGTQQSRPFEVTRTIKRQFGIFAEKMGKVHVALLDGVDLEVVLTSRKVVQAFGPALGVVQVG